MTETPLIAAGVVNGDRKLADLLAVAIVEHGVCSGTSSRSWSVCASSTCCANCETHDGSSASVEERTVRGV